MRIQYIHILIKLPYDKSEGAVVDTIIISFFILGLFYYKNIALISRIITFYYRAYKSYTTFVISRVQISPESA